MHSLWRIFRQIVSHESFSKVYIIIDVLDECDPESIQEFLSLLEHYIMDDESSVGIRTSLLHQGEEQPGKVKWLLASRNEAAIREMLTGALDISLEINRVQVEHSVERFIEVKLAKLQRLKKYDNKFRNLVQNTLRDRAEGTFLWVSLACQELAKHTVNVINTRRVLYKLPPGLAPIYTRILEQILQLDDETKAFVTSTLRAMIIAVRPLNLTELAVVANLPGEYRLNMAVLTEYVSMCGSLVTVRNHTAYFIHQSAKTFLMGLNSGIILSNDICEDHQIISLNCFSYVCHSLPKTITRLTISWATKQERLSLNTQSYSGRSILGNRHWKLQTNLTWKLASLAWILNRERLG